MLLSVSMIIPACQLIKKILAMSCCQIKCKLERNNASLAESHENASLPDWQENASFSDNQEKPAYHVVKKIQAWEKVKKNARL